jgi:Flp pilus assembly protein TadG
MIGLRHRHRTRGQALVEFAMIFPILALVIFGIIDLGRLVYTQNALNEAAREGARAGSVRDRPADCSGQTRDVCAQTIARGRLVGVIGSGTPTVECNSVTQLDADNNNELDMVVVSPPSGCRANDLFKVSVTNNFTLLTPLIAQFVGTFTLRGETQVTVQS